MVHIWMVQKSTKQAWLCLQYTKRRYNYHMAYIAQQIKVGPFILPNRFVMGSMHTGLEGDLKKQGIYYHIIGGALLADELDAKRSIDEGARLGNKL